MVYFNHTQFLYVISNKLAWLSTWKIQTGNFDIFRNFQKHPWACINETTHQKLHWYSAVKATFKKVYVTIDRTGFN
jgi:hypothetical protein